VTGKIRGHVRVWDGSTSANTIPETPNHLKHSSVHDLSKAREQEFSRQKWKHMIAKPIEGVLVVI